jgi:hypothetical protein
MLKLFDEFINESGVQGINRSIDLFLRVFVNGSRRTRCWLVSSFSLLWTLGSMQHTFYRADK